MDSSIKEDYKLLFIGIIILCGVYFLYKNAKEPIESLHIEMTPNSTYLMNSKKCENINLYYENSDTDIVSVDSNGKIYALKEGNTRVVSRNENNEICSLYEIKIKNDTEIINKKVLIEEIIIDDIELEESAVQEIKYNLFPSEATEKVNIVSNDEKIVIVSNNQIKAIKTGVTTITLENENGTIRKNINVEVLKRQSNGGTEKPNNGTQNGNIPIILFKQTIVNINKGELYEIEYIKENIDGDIEWNSNDNNVVSVNNGIIKGINSGTATVTGKYGKTSASITIVVSNNTNDIVVNEILISSNNLLLNVGSNSKITYKVLPNDATNKEVKWTSSNTNVAVVDMNGKITGIGVGQAVITVKTNNEKMATCIVTVNNKEEPVQIIKDKDAPTLLINKNSGANIKDISIKISVSDNNGVGLADDNNYKYYLSTSNLELKDGEWINYVNDVEFTIGKGITGTRYLWVYRISDKVGNFNNSRAQYVIGTYTFDNKAPTLTINKNSASNVEAVTLKLTAKDNVGGSGLDTKQIYKYYLSTSDSELKGGTWTDYKNDVEFTIGKGITGTRYLWVYRISDKVGNVNNSMVQYVIGTYIFGVKKKSYKIHFLPYPSSFYSDSTLIEVNGRYGLVDIGLKNSSISSVTNIVIPYLKSLNIKTLDFIIITHDHNDHRGDLSTLVKNFKINKIYVKEKHCQSSIYNSIVKVAKENNIPITYVESLQEGSTIFNSEGVSIKLFNTKYIPDAYGHGHETVAAGIENDNSIITFINMNGKKVVLPGDTASKDISGPIYSKIGKVDVWKVAHHGNLYPDDFMEGITKLNPTYSIIQSTIVRDQNNVSTNFQVVTAKTLIFDLYGTIKITTK